MLFSIIGSFEQKNQYEKAAYDEIKSAVQPRQCIHKSDCKIQWIEVRIVTPLPVFTRSVLHRLLFVP